MKFRKILIIVLLISISFKTAKAQIDPLKQKSEQIESEFPKQIGFVNDYEKIFTDEQIKFLENLLNDYKKTLNREIAVITIDSIPKGTDFQQYAIKLSESWKVGKDNNGNGLTIVLSKTLKSIRISTTDKTKHLYISDEFCNKVIYENMIPEFKKGNYYVGIIFGLNELIKKWI